MRPLICAIVLGIASTHANAEHFAVPPDAIEKVVFAVGMSNCAIKNTKQSMAGFYVIRVAAFTGPCDLGSRRGKISAVMSIKRADAQLPEAVEMVTVLKQSDLEGAWQEMTTGAKANNPEFAKDFDDAVAAVNHPKDSGY